MHELTAYFVSTGRRHAAAALESLNAQSLERDVVVVRDVCPMHRAYATTLDCPTEFCLVLDDDVILEPGVVPPLVEEFRRRRAEDPRVYMLAALTHCEAKDRPGPGGFKLFHAPSLARVGWPDSPHVMHVQLERAARLGLLRVQSGVHVGVQKVGSDLDLYKKYLWMAVRARAGQLRAAPLSELLDLARRTHERRWWIACLGTLDARDVDAVGSKDERFVGALARGVRVDEAGVDELARLVTAHLPRT